MPGATRKRTAQGGPKREQKRQKTSSGIKQRVPVADLPWKLVKTPEMFGDAEGFFGLEEVTGVKVVRSGGLVEFHATVTRDQAASEHVAENEASDEEEFQGFDDDPVVAHQEVEEPPKPESNTKPRKKEKKQAKLRSDEYPPAHTEENVATESEGDRKEKVDMSAWKSLKLSPRMLGSLANLGFSKPTTIQKAAIPDIMAGQDVVGKASTGSGKTLAFAVPIVEKWLEENPSGSVQRTEHCSGDNSSKAQEEQENEEEEGYKAPIALILSPTRELAHQITAHIKSLCSTLEPWPNVCSVTGGLSVYKQQRLLRSADIVIGTPGRLWEVISSSSSILNAFKRIKFLVIDEGDRLLSEGHFKEASDILQALDRQTTNEDYNVEGEGEEEEGEEEGEEGGGEAEAEAGKKPQLHSRQTLVFSATFNKSLQQKLTSKGRYDLLGTNESMEYLLKKLNFRQRKPKFIDVNPISQMAKGLQEGLIECGAEEKDLYLYALLLHHPQARTLIFTNSINTVRRLVPLLQNLRLNALSLHSEMAQKARLRSLERFSASSTSGKSPILVATDVAARGLDINDVDLVVHYHVPRAADAYIHRSGRTARASRSGKSVLLCAPGEAVPTRKLIASVHARDRVSTETGQDGVQRSGSFSSKGSSFYVRTLEIDRRLVQRLKGRLTLAKQLADVGLAREKLGKEAQWLRAAADDLGLEYDEAELEAVGQWSGKGSGRRKHQQQIVQLDKATTLRMRAELNALLAQPINTGVSERYLAAGGAVDVESLLRAQSEPNASKDGFLGEVDGLGFD